MLTAGQTWIEDGWITLRHGREDFLRAFFCLTLAGGAPLLFGVRGGRCAGEDL